MVFRHFHKHLINNGTESMVSEIRKYNSKIEEEPLINGDILLNESDL